MSMFDFSFQGVAREFPQKNRAHLARILADMVEKCIDILISDSRIGKESGNPGYTITGHPKILKSRTYNL